MDKINLLMSIAAVGTFLFELVWNIDFFYELIFRKSLINLADYMFDKKYHAGLRALSTFHIAMPIIWIVHLYQFGYDPASIIFLHHNLLDYFAPQLPLFHTT